jgi:uncharacterized membrane protein
MVEIFNSFSTQIVFLHIISAVIWVGGMIAIRFGVHYSLIGIEDSTLRLKKTLEILQRFFNITKYFILILVITAVIMVVAIGFKGTPLNVVVHIKEGIWTIMILLFIWIYILRNKAQKLFDNQELELARDRLKLISKYIIPTNITLGIIAIYLGVVLRGI